MGWLVGEFVAIAKAGREDSAGCGENVLQLHFPLLVVLVLIQTIWVRPQRRGGSALPDFGVAAMKRPGIRSRSLPLQVLTCFAPFGCPPPSPLPLHTLFALGSCLPLWFSHAGGRGAIVEGCRVQEAKQAGCEARSRRWYRPRWLPP